jgi:serine/threonine protein phosphatase PrpC
MTENDFKKNLKINNGSFSSTINFRNDKFIHTYGNIYNDKMNFFKSSNGLKTTKNKNKKEKIIKNINNEKKNNKTKVGLKKYLTYFQVNNPLNDKKFHNKKQSISILGQINNQILKNSFIIEKKKINKRVMKINSCTLAGYTAPGIQKINQDNFFIKKDFLNEPEQFFIGICDGHGIQGHLISEFVSTNLPNYLNEITDKSIKKAYLNIQNLLQNENNKIDSSLSGTTCTSIIVSQNNVICANVGDSRAILSRYENGVYNSINLSRDHKPTESDEMKRILSKGGRIKQFFDVKINEYIGPERIWLNNSEIPGLAMSRSIGDTIAHSVGVISEPEIIKIDFVGSEKFIVIASDGIWEYIDSDECVKIIKDYYENNMDAVGGLNALVKEAFKRWKIEEDNIDDITAIVLFFE